MRTAGGGTDSVPVDKTVASLQTALAAEHVAIYGYGIVGAHLFGAQREKARRLWDAHRARRDQLRALVVARGATPAAAAPAYRLPGKVTTSGAAVKLAAALEDGLVSGYLALAAANDARLRQFAARAMQEAVIRSLDWGGSAPPAFPGMSARTAQPTPRPTSPKKP